MASEDEETMTPDDESPAAAAEVAASEVKVEEKKKRGRKRKAPGEATPPVEKKAAKQRKEVALPVERPSRERKTVERFIQMSPRKASVSKVLTIEQGPGTKLKDIPNAFFKLSKRKIDENLRVLHSILFGRKSKAYFLKRNISQFSGFVWADNEEKQRLRVKEKLDKCTKDRLLDFSELLDIQITRVTAKKEEIAEKLLEFLKSPHATRDVVLSEKEKKGKHKRRSKGIVQSATGGASSDREEKKHKSNLETEVRKRRRSDKAKKEDDDEGGLDEKEDEDEHGSSEEEDVDEGGSISKDEESDLAKSEDDDNGDEPEESMAGTKGSFEKQKAAEQKIKENPSPVKKNLPAKSDKSSKPVRGAFSDAEDVPNVPARSKRGGSKSQASTKEKAAAVNKDSVKSHKSISKSSSRKSTVDDSDSDPPSSSKTKKENKKKDQSNDIRVRKDNNAVKKQAAKAVSKVSTKEQGKGKSSKNAKVRPSTEELHSVVSNILKEVDFNTATLADILKQLGDHFNTNLMDRKSEVKQIIQDVINSMTDDEEGEEDEEDAGNAEGGDDTEEKSNGNGE